MLGLLGGAGDSPSQVIWPLAPPPHFLPWAGLSGEQLPRCGPPAMSPEPVLPPLKPEAWAWVSVSLYTDGDGFQMREGKGGGMTSGEPNMGASCGQA